MLISFITVGVMMSYRTDNHSTRLDLLFIDQVYKN